MLCYLKKNAVYFRMCTFELTHTDASERQSCPLTCIPRLRLCPKERIRNVGGRRGELCAQRRASCCLI